MLVWVCVCARRPSQSQAAGLHGSKPGSARLAFFCCLCCQASQERIKPAVLIQTDTCGRRST